MIKVNVGFQTIWLINVTFIQVIILQLFPFLIIICYQAHSQEETRTGLKHRRSSQKVWKWSQSHLFWHVLWKTRQLWGAQSQHASFPTSVLHIYYVVHDSNSYNSDSVEPSSLRNYGSFVILSLFVMGSLNVPRTTIVGEFLWIWVFILYFLHFHFFLVWSQNTTGEIFWELRYKFSRPVWWS